MSEVDLNSYVSYQHRQEAQLSKYLEWKNKGGFELPIQLTTLMRPEQQFRINWIKSNCHSRDVIELGTNFGFILASVGGRVGIDISEQCVELARVLQPDKTFLIADITKPPLPFAPHEFDVCIMAEVLEHLLFETQVPIALSEAIRITRHTLLITFPNGEHDTVDAVAPRHAWLGSVDRVEKLQALIPGKKKIIFDKNFVLIKADIDK